jgi:penicillin-binding protein 1B
MDSLFGTNSDTAGTSVTGGGINSGQPAQPGQPSQNGNEGQQQQQHRNFFQKMFGFGKHNNDETTAPATTPQPVPNTPH